MQHSILKSYNVGMLRLARKVFARTRNVYYVLFTNLPSPHLSVAETKVGYHNVAIRNAKEDWNARYMWRFAKTRLNLKK